MLEIYIGAEHLVSAVGSSIQVERGFLVNKHILKNNLKEESLISQRLIHQAIPKSGRKFLDIKINKQMIADVRMAWRRYQTHLEEERAVKTEEERQKEEKKRKKKQLTELLAKKKNLEAEHACLQKDVDLQIENLEK